MHRIRAIHTVGLSALMLLGGISSSLSAEVAKVSGTLTYQQTTALPPDTVVYVSIVDVSPLEDNSGDMIARQTIAHPRQGPIAFEVEYDPARISSNHLYALQIQITAGNRILFRNTSAYPVITKGNPSSVQVSVDPVK